MASVIFAVSAQWNSVGRAIRIIIPRLRYLINCGDYEVRNSADPIEGGS